MNDDETLEAGPTPAEGEAPGGAEAVDTVRRCGYRHPDGRQCDAAPLTTDSRCWFHSTDPLVVAKRDAARSLGATKGNLAQATREQRRAERLARKATKTVSEARLQMTRIVEAQAGPQSPGELKAVLSRLLVAVSSGSIPPAAASAASSIASALSKVIEESSSATNATLTDRLPVFSTLFLLEALNVLDLEREATVADAIAAAETQIAPLPRTLPEIVAWTEALEAVQRAKYAADRLACPNPAVVPEEPPPDYFEMWKTARRLRPEEDDIIREYRRRESA